MAGAVLLGWLILRLLKRFILKVLQRLTTKSKTKFDDIIVSETERFLLPYLNIVVAYYGLEQLTITPKVDKYLTLAFAFVTTYYFVRIVIHALHQIIYHVMEQKGEPPERIRQLSGLLVVMNVVIWSVGILMLVSNLGYDITTIITGLGIGGIAIALAAQNILSDVFSYFVIFFDKPFKVGDSIIINGMSGTVERIGIKTSHIRSISGELLIMPNAEIVKSTIQNFYDLTKRRVVFTLTLHEESTEAQIQSIPGIIKEIIDGTEHVVFDRSHLSGFGNATINFETVYFVNNPDYKVYMDAQQQIYLGILKAFRENNIRFLFFTFPPLQAPLAKKI